MLLQAAWQRLGVTVIAFGVGLAAAQSSMKVPVLAPLHTATKPIVDGFGYSQYLVDFVAGTHDQFPDVDTADDSGRFAERHSAKARNMARTFEKRYGVTVINMTSYVGDSVTAHLSPAVLAQVRNDPSVALVTEVGEGQVELSGPPWSDSTTSPPSSTLQLQSWGWYAMNGKISSSGLNLPRIYIIDAGVGLHSDLPNSSITRVNPNSTVSTPISAVSCYSHSTHVAGIISAINGGGGTVGVLPGAPLWSVSAATNQLLDGTSGHKCSDPRNTSVTTPGIAAAMDWIKHDIIYNGLYRVGIVNISINGADFKSGNTLGNKMLDLATRYIGGFVYQGAFVVQAAGNNYTDACTVSYSATSTTDGIMVVGGITKTGAAATSYTDMPYTVDQAGSNYGNCVEIWAPSAAIWAGWGPDVPLNYGTPSTWQADSVTYSTYGVLGGTSFAAPHIAALAAYLSAVNGLGGPSDIEAGVRATMYTAGMTHPVTGQTLYYGKLP